MFGIGGQFINYFLSKTLAGMRSLEATRHHLIASSPIYFADRLPLAQVPWGIEDTIVPVVNGRDLVARYQEARGGTASQEGGCLDVQFHPQAGHDQDRQRAPAQSRAFLLRAFELGEEEIARCRPN